MRKNLEIKVKIKNINETQKLAKSFCKGKETQHFVQRQEDIYYQVDNGRLKLRIINGKTGNLIHYFRNNKTRKRVSNYTISETSTPEPLNAILTSLFGRMITVKKKREIFITDNIRIHIDKVTGLGNFIEFEIIFNSITKAQKIMNELIEHFKLDEKQFIKPSYSDLLLNKK